jgi:hypothetical protein
MRNKLENLLLGTLWVLVSVLGLCFWFNIKYGFNLLSSAHWHHLSYMQATRTPIVASFYISLIIGVFFIVFGLYILIRPKFRKIKLPVQTPEQQTPEKKEIKQETDEFGLSRPRRLSNIDHNNTEQKQQQNKTPGTPLTAPVASAQHPSPQTQLTPPTTVTETNNSELKEIFESTGYTVKKSPRIHGYQTALMAIGSNETVWLGAIGIETSTMQSIVDTLNQVFLDTLDDINITIHGFVIDAHDTSAPAPNILTFATNDELRQYMQEHSNPPTDPDMIENFNAFSEYISTVIDYIGRL